MPKIKDSEDAAIGNDMIDDTDPVVAVREALAWFEGPSFIPAEAYGQLSIIGKGVTALTAERDALAKQARNDALKEATLELRSLAAIQIDRLGERLSADERARTESRVAALDNAIHRIRALKTEAQP